MKTKNLILGCILACISLSAYTQEKVLPDLDSPKFEALEEKKRNELLEAFFTANMPNTSVADRAAYVLYNIKSEAVRNAYVLPALVEMLEQYGYTNEVKGLVEDIEICSKTAETIRKAKELETKYYPVQKDEIAPDFDLEDEFGKRVKLSDFAGKSVFIAVWSLGCEESLKGLPAFVGLQEQYGKREDVVFLTICIGKDLETWKEFLKQKGYSGRTPHLRGGEKDVFEDNYCITKVPRYILIGRDGKIINAWHIGADNEYFPFFFSMELGEAE